jgi:hypothetical protein
VALRHVGGQHIPRLRGDVVSTGRHDSHADATAIGIAIRIADRCTGHHVTATVTVSVSDDGNRAGCHLVRAASERTVHGRLCEPGEGRRRSGRDLGSR